MDKMPKIDSSKLNLTIFAPQKPKIEKDKKESDSFTLPKLIKQTSTNSFIDKMMESDSGSDGEKADHD